jgi:putative two-component system response regulator
VPRVLCVDDDRLIRRFLHEALTAGGFEVILAVDGAQAMRLLDGSVPFDLLITDQNMPMATGVEVIEHAKRVDPALPAIIVTAYHDLDLAMRAMQAGAVGFIPKPFKPDHLLTVAGRALEHRQLAADAMRLNLLVPMLERFTMMLADTLESKDCATSRHAERLVGHSEAVARELGLDDDVRFSIRVGACLHDIGKVGVPEHVLRKAGPLTMEERAMMRLHPEIGAAILEDIDTWEDVRIIVRHHHEHWNGAGYPHGLRSTDIPVGARIVSVVDAFDVMIAGRPYAPARPLEQAIEELIAERGRQFDPDAVDALVATLARPGDYHDVVDTVSELDLIARRAHAPASTRSMVGGATR